MGLYERLMGHPPPTHSGFDVEDMPVAPVKERPPPPPRLPEASEVAEGGPTKRAPEVDLIIGQSTLTGMNWKRREEHSAHVVGAGRMARECLRTLGPDDHVIVLISDPTCFDPETWLALRYAARYCHVQFEVIP